MFRPSGEAVLIDFGLSHHNQLPDLMQEEFRVPYRHRALHGAGAAARRARRSAQRSVFARRAAVFLHDRRAARSARARRWRGMRRRLWRDPYPPRQLKADYPPWLQEIVLRCLEIEPVWRYPTASQLAFELAPSRPGQADGALRAARSAIRSRRVWRRRFNGNLRIERRRGKSAVAAQLASSPIVAVALDLAEGSSELNDALRVTADASWRPCRRRGSPA